MTEVERVLSEVYWLLIFGCLPDNHIIILVCLVHDLVVLGERTTAISNAVYQRAETCITRQLFVLHDLHKGQYFAGFLRKDRKKSYLF